MLPKRKIGAPPTMAVLIVEQMVREALKIADRVYVLRNGRVSFSGASTDLQDEAKLRDVYL
jgi:branched-chain amino acid transport system ATP-binding protein